MQVRPLDPVEGMGGMQQSKAKGRQIDIEGRFVKSGEIEPERLLDFPWLVYMADPAYEMETVHATVERIGAAPPVQLKCESLIAAIRLLQTGDYLCILPDAALANTSMPRIVPLPVGLGRRQVPTGAIFREENSDWPPLTHLLELCASGAADGP